MIKLMKSFFVVFAAIFISILSTGAFLSDSETSVGNSFTAGTWEVFKEPVINEILSIPADTISEWIELKNRNSTILDLNGYTIQDGTTNIKNLNGYSIPANGYLVLNKGIDFSFILNNAGDIVILKKSGNIVDQTSYGNWPDGNTADNAPAPGIDQSIARIPNGQDTDIDSADFQIRILPTPGLLNL